MSEFRWEIDPARFDIAMNGGINAATSTGADEIVRNVKSRPGRSVPGESPTSQRGTLRGSYGSTPAQNGEAYIGSSVRYAMYLEEGAPNAGRRSHPGKKGIRGKKAGRKGKRHEPLGTGLLPRPHIMDGLRKGRARMLRSFEEAFARLIRRKGV